MGLPSPDLLSLSESVSFVVCRCNCSNQEAKEALRRAGVDRRLHADGLVPLSAHSDPKKRDAHPYRRREDLRPEDWDTPIDWDVGRIGLYSSVLIKRLSIEVWLAHVPTATVLQDKALKLAPDAEIKRAIETIYEEEKVAGAKPSNIKELAGKVQALLKEKGYHASGRHIQKLGEAYKNLRWPAGKRK